MDDRIRGHAEILVEDCTDVEQGDMVHVRASPQAEDLVVALYTELGERGAHPSLSRASSRASRAYGRKMDPGDVETSAHSLAAMEETDAIIMISGGGNTKESVDMPTEYREAAQRALQPILQERLDKRWVITHYPTEAGAKQAEMSTAAYEDFVWSAINRDWAQQREHQAQMVELLDPAEEVRIVAGGETDITLDVAGMNAKNDAAENNMPGGEAFTAPRREGVDGTVRFDMPVLFQGHEIEECVPEDVEKNESATHVDMLVDMSEDSRIELDGEVVQRNGTFVFEAGFEG